MIYTYPLCKYGQNFVKQLLIAMEILVKKVLHGATLRDFL
jgi:hypothetical protein